MEETPGGHVFPFGFLVTLSWRPGLQNHVGKDTQLSPLWITRRPFLKRLERRRLKTMTSVRAAAAHALRLCPGASSKKGG